MKGVELFVIVVVVATALGAIGYMIAPDGPTGLQTLNQPPTQLASTAQAETLPLVLSLNDYFFDPEGDPLIYLASDNTITIDGSTLTFTPSADSPQEYFTTITVTDGTNTVAKPFTFILPATETQADTPAASPAHAQEETRGTLQEQPLEQPSSSQTDTEISRDTSSERTISATCGTCTDCTTCAATPGDTCVLTANIDSADTCITVPASGVTINCAGFNITYASTTDNSFGIDTAGVSNTVITGCNITQTSATFQASPAINLGTSGGGFQVLNSRLITPGAGISGSGITSLIVQNTSFNLSTGASGFLTSGIDVSGTNIVIRNNSFSATGNGIGIESSGSTLVNISNNTFSIAGVTPGNALELNINHSNVSGNRMIATTSNSNFNGQNVTVTDNRFRSLNWVTGTNFTWRSNRASSTGEHIFDPRTGNATSMNDTFTGRLVLRSINFTMHNSTFNSTSIGVLRVAGINITIENATARASGGIHLIGVNGSGHILSNITIQATATPLLNLTNTTNSTFTNLNLSTTSTWISFIGTITDNRFFNINMSTSNGSIFYPEFNVSTTGILNRTNVTITLNQTFVNTTGLPFLNQSAQIQLRNLTFTDPRILIDTNDDGVYATCAEPDCTEISYDGSNITFNVTHFTSHAISEGANAHPTIAQVILNSTDGSGETSNESLTTENLTVVVINATDADNQSVQNITDWRVNGASIAVLNMPFETNTTEITTGAIRDYSTHINNGTVGGGVSANAPIWTTGVAGGGYNFDGVDDLISVPDSSSLRTGQTSVELWVNSDSWSGAALRNPIAKYTHLPAAGWTFSFGGTFDFSECPGTDEGELLVFNGGVIIPYCTPLSTGAWYHIAFTNDGATTRIYVNGTLVASGSQLLDNLHANPLTVGIRSDNNFPFDGRIDEVRVYNRTLSQAQIAQSYADGLAGRHAESTVSAELALGNNWSVAVTPNDNQNASDGTTVISNAVTISANTHSTIAQVILNNSNGAGYNLNLSNTSSNLTVFVINATDADGDQVQNITDWRINGASIAVLNLPFETNFSNNTVDAARDYSTFGNNGTLGNGTAGAVPTWNISGKVGGAYTFDGTDDYIDCGVSGLPSTAPLTLEAWAYFNQDQGASEYDYVIQASGFDGTDLFAIAREAATNNVYYVENGVLRTGPALPTGSWHHVVMVFRTTAPYVRFYLNGTNQTIAQPASGPVAPTGGLLCGLGRFGAPDHFLNGSLDEVKIYNYELPAEQVYQNYLDGNRSKHVENIMSAELTGGENWSVAVTPNDQRNASDGTTVLSNNVTIQADPLYTGTPTLNGSQFGNTSPENLTANLTVISGVKTFTNWYLSDTNANNKSLLLINMPMDGGALAGSQVKDYSSNSNNANIVGGATYSSAGGYDGKGAYTFDGTSDGFTFANNISFGQQDNWTIAFWAQNDNDGGVHGTILGPQARGTVTDVIWFLSNIIEFRNNTVGTDVPEMQFSFDGNATFQHYAFVANNHRLELYVNGTFFQAIDAGTAFRLDGVGMWNSAAFDFQGTVDDLSIWNVSLTPSQVRKLYEGNTTVFHSAMTRVGDTLLSQVTPNNNVIDDTTQYSNNLTVGEGDIFGRNQTFLNSSSETNTSVENLTINVTYATNVSQVHSYYRNGSPILAAYYTFNTEEDVVRDYSGNGRNGSRRRLVVWQPTSGYDGRGVMNFAGSDDSLTIPAMTWTNRQPWSVSFWAQKDLDGSQGNVMGTRDDSTDTIWLLSTSLEFRNSTDGLGGTAFAWDANTSRNFYTLVAPGTDRLELYVNGTFFDALDVGTGFTINDIGDSASSFSFDGTIDDVAIWNTTLTPSQIRALFNNRSDVIVNSMTGVSDVWQLRATPNDNFSDGNTTVLSLTVLDGDTFGFSTATLSGSPDTSNTSNLTANFSYTANVDKNVVWYVNGTSTQLLNLPFDSEAYPVRDYAANQSYTRFGDSVWEPTAGVDGRGQLHFDGSNDYVSVPQFSLLGTQPWTLTVWAKKDIDNSNGGFVGTTNGVTDFISIRSTDVEFRNSTTGGGGPSFAFDANTSLHFYAFRAGGNGSLELFVNGSRIGAVTAGTNFTINNIGAAVAGTGEDFDGTLDEFILWNRSLSQEQIQTLYAGNNTLIVSQETTPGDTWQACEVPTDGIDDGQVRCTNAVTISANTHPTIAQVILNSTDGSGYLGNNASTRENLTVFVINATDADNDSVQNITDWRLNGTSIAVLNMPFETNSSNLSTGAIRDYSTSGNNATLGGGDSANASVWNATGKIGGAYTFDGSNDYLSSPHSASLDIGNGVMTYTAWIKHGPAVAVDGSIIFDKAFNDGSSDRLSVMVEPANGRLRLSARSDPGAGGLVSRDSTSEMNNSQWQHIAVVVDVANDNVTIYINGSLNQGAQSGTWPSSIVTDSAFYIGSNFINGAGSFFNGSIDEALVFNRTLSANQIYQLYLDGNNSKHSETFVSDELSADDTWSVAVTPNDQRNASDGTTVISNSVTISDVNTHPTIAQVILNSTDGSGYIGNNATTSENLTVFIINATDADNDSVQNITDWRLGGSSIAVVNLPFETNTSSTTAGAVKDYSTHGINATLGGGTAANVPAWNFTGKAGGGYDYDGVDDYINVPAAKSAVNTTAFTITAWVRPTGAQSSRGILQWADGLGSTTPWILLQRETTTTIRWYLNGDYRITSTVTDGGWVHLALTYDGATWRSFINGSAQGTYVGPLGTNGGASFWLGNGFNGYFQGSIDEVLIFNRTLSAQEINQSYLDGAENRHIETMVSQELAVGNNWSVAVTPNDNQNASDGTTVLSNGVTIQEGACTTLTFSANTTITTNQTCDNIIVLSGVHVRVNNSAAGNVPLGFFATNFTLQSGAVINSTGAGFAGGGVNLIGGGPGGGAADGATAGAGGAGHGGLGGASGGGRVGGHPYGSSLTPITLGSGGGGSGGGAGTPGSAGGGAVAIYATVANISGTLAADGYNAASGVPQTSSGPGAGSGGSIYILSDQLIGTGSISANGGRGGDASPSNPNGGGGGAGGHVIVSFNTSTFDISRAGVNGGGSGIGASTSGVPGRVGTLAFINTNTSELMIKQGWRWLANDSTLWNYSTVNLTNATTLTNGSTLYFSAQTFTSHNSSISAEYIIYNMSLNATTFWLNASNITNASISNLSATNVMIAAGASFNSTGSGFAGGAATLVGSGPGGGAGSALTGGGGGGHAGIGGLSGGSDAGGNPYGSSMTPVTLGSGGGGAGGGAGTSGAGGGGAIIINASTVSVNGSIIASGADGASGVPVLSSGPGGGSGGTIFITTDSIGGTGQLLSRGGTGGIASGSNPRGGGGGGGGRILVQFNTSTFPITQARVESGAGGFGATASGSAGQAGSLAFVNLTGNTLAISGGFRWQPNDRSIWSFTTINVTDAFTRVNGSSVNFSATTIELWNSSMVGERAIYNLSLNATSFSLNTSNITNGSTINMSVTNLTISTASQLSGAGSGFTGGAVNVVGNGPGGGSADGTTNGAGGGALGGIGGDSGGGRPGGSPYGSSLTPATLGSGGGGSGGGAGTPGAHGGGFISLVTNRLSVDGTINVSGYDALSGVPQTSAGSGGGAGGSLAILTDILEGAGTLAATGGRGGDASGSNPRGGGGGAGGRILARFNTSTFPITQASVSGGSFGTGASLNGTAGQPGTLGFLNLTGDTLTISGGWRWQPDDRAIWNFTLINITNAITRVNGSSVNFSAPRVELFNSTIAGERSVIYNATFNVTNLTMNGSNVTHGSVLNLTVQDAYLLSAVVNSTGTGFTGGGPNVAGQGPGGGGAPGGTAGAGGAGHGGRGGASGGSSTVGGAVYGTSLNAATRGSGGGGSGGGAGGTGGNGGGSLNIFAQRLVLNGTLSVNGAPGQDGAAVSASGAGGGSGGTITITTNTLEGNGSMTANGGKGGDGSVNPNGGGGGGGGRIIVRFNTSTLAITNMTVTGGLRGEGTPPGQAGQVGTLAFFDTDDSSLTLKDGWRWQVEDAPLSFTNITALSFTNVRSNSSTINASRFVANQSNWTVEDQTTILNASSLSIENGVVNASTTGARIALRYAAVFSDINTSYIVGSRVTLANHSAAELNWTNFTSTAGNLSAHVRLSANRVFVNSSNQSALNRSANITLYNINVPDPFPIFDGEDDGTFITCPSTRCTEISYDGSTFVFNVSGFTSYSSSGGVSLTKTDSPDPVTAGQTLSYTLLINNSNGNITNVTVVETYPAQVTFNSSQPTPNVSNNTWQLADIAVNGTFQINITVNVSSGVANGTVINNTANLTFNNLSGTSFFVNVTENTTVVAADACPLDLLTSTTLTENITCPATAINILADNVVFDCAGYNISYANSAFGFGINVTGRTNVTIQNCVVVHSNASVLEARGLVMNRSNSSTIVNSTINVSGHISSIGLSVVASSNDTLRDTVIFANSDAVSLQNSPNNTVQNVSATSNLSRGVDANGANNSLFFNVTAVGDAGIGFSAQLASYANISGVVASSIQSVSMQVASSVGVNASNITAVTFGTASVGSDALFVSSVRGSTFDGISAQTPRGTALSISTSHNNTFNNTQAKGQLIGGGGLGASASSNNTFANMNVTSYATSAFALNSQSMNNTVSRVNVLGSTSALFLLASSDGNVLDELVIDTNGTALVFNGVVNNTLSDSIIRSNLNWIIGFNQNATRMTNTTFDAPLNGSISYPGTFDLPNLTVSAANLLVTQNKSYLNSTNLSFLNTSAQITLSNISFTDPRVVVDFEDDGTFATCNSPDCDEVSYTGGTFVFNVSHFTSHAASESPQCPLNITTTTTLTGNVACPATAINILADNLTLDCAGYNVSYAATSVGLGVNISGFSNVTIRNCNIIQNNASNSGSGIVSTSASNNSILGNNISTSHLFSSGITISTGNGHTLVDNNVTANGTGTHDGITLNSVTNSTVANNTALIPGNTSSTNGAISIVTGNNVSFSNNSGISNNSPGILFTNTVNSTLINNSAFSSDNQGLILFESTAGREQNNTVINSTGTSTTSIGLAVQSNANRNTVIGSRGTSITSIGIWLRSDRNTLNNSIGTSTSNIGIRVDGTANVIDYSTGSGSTGISLQAGGTNSDLNLTNSNGTTTSGTGINLNANYANLSNVIGTATSGFGIQVSGSNSRNNSIRNSTFLSNTGQALRLDGASAINNSIANTTLRTNATWIAFFALPSENHFENTTFDNANGSIRIIPRVTPVVGSFVQNIATAQLNTSLNRSFLNSANLTEFNTTAQITLRGINFTDPQVLVDFEDDGSFATCNPLQCTEVSYAGGTFVFNVSSFTSYASAETVAGTINLTFDKTDSSDPIVRGTTLNYTIEINNTGTAAAENLTVVETYPAGVSFVTSSPLPTAGNNTFALGNLTNGSTTTINITVTVGSNVANGTVLNNTYNISFQNTTGSTISGNDSEMTTVIGIATVTVTKTDSPDPVNNGSTLSYTITITNTGDETAYNVTVVDGYDVNLTFNGSSPVPSAGNNTFSLGDLLPGNLTTINITVNVSPTMTSGVLNNTVNVTFANASGVNVTTSAFQATTVTTPAVPAAPSGGGGGGGSNFFRNANVTREQPAQVAPITFPIAVPQTTPPTQSQKPAAQEEQPPTETSAQTPVTTSRPEQTSLAGQSTAQTAEWQISPLLTTRLPVLALALAIFIAVILATALLLRTRTTSATIAPVQPTKIASTPLKKTTQPQQAKTPAPKSPPPIKTPKPRNPATELKKLNSDVLAINKMLREFDKKLKK